MFEVIRSMREETLAMNEAGCADVSCAHASASARGGRGRDVSRRRTFVPRRPSFSTSPRRFFAWLVGFCALWTLRATPLFDAVDAHIGPIPRALQAHASRRAREPVLSPTDVLRRRSGSFGHCHLRFGRRLRARCSGHQVERRPCFGPADENRDLGIGKSRFVERQGLLRRQERLQG